MLVGLSIADHCRVLIPCLTHLVHANTVGLCCMYREDNQQNNTVSLWIGRVGLTCCNVHCLKKRRLVLYRNMCDMFYIVSMLSR